MIRVNDENFEKFRKSHALLDEGKTTEAREVFDSMIDSMGFDFSICGEEEK